MHVYFVSACYSLPVLYVPVFVRLHAWIVVVEAHATVLNKLESLLSKQQTAKTDNEWGILILEYFIHPVYYFSVTSECLKVGCLTS